MKKLFILIAIVLAVIHFTATAQTLNQVILPQYIQGLNGTNNDRVPYAFRVTLSGLTPSATYRYNTRIVTKTDGATSSGAGNTIFVNSDGSFTRTTNQDFATIGRYGEFTTDGTGSFTGWFILEPTGNARFTPGNYVKPRIILNDGAGGTSAAHYLTTTDSVLVINFGSTASDATGIVGTQFGTDKNFVFIYDNTSGAGRPIGGTVIENEGADNVAGSYVDYYDTYVNGVSRAWGSILPNTLPNGIKRIEERSLSTGSIGTVETDNDGIWPNGANTINPTGGKTNPIIIQPLVADTPIVMNEIYSRGTTGNPDWIELYNPKNVPVVISGYKIYDSGGKSGSKPKMEIPLSTEISAKGYYVIVVDDGSASGFGLSSTGEWVWFENASGDVIDSVQFPALDTNQSYSRIPDGGSWKKTTTVTKNAANVFTYDVYDIKLNEIYSRGTTGAPDWIEVYNNEDKAIDLSGFLIYDNGGQSGSKPKKEFPNGSIILSKNVLVIVVDDGTASGFGLSSSGERVWLANPVGSVLDSVDFPALGIDSSYARIPDGVGAWQIVSPPTKNALNYTPIIPDTFVVINELYSRGISVNLDWIEIYNFTSNPVDLTGYKIYDNGGFSGSKPKKEFPNGTIIPPLGFYVITVDDGTASGFGLSSGGETVWLEDSNGSVIDNITFPALLETETYGRWPDGATNWRKLNIITKGSNNKYVDMTGLDTLTYKTTPHLLINPYGKGYIAGVNEYGDIGKYQRLDFNPGDTLHAMNLYFGHQDVVGTPDTINIVLKSVAGDGKPSNTLLSTWTTSEVLQVNSTTGNLFAFDNPIELSGPVFIGFEWSTTADDTFAVFCDEDGEGNNANRVWEKFSDGQYNDFLTVFNPTYSWDIDVDLWIEAYYKKGPGVGIEDNISSIPTDFKLEQNYPNPFNPSTTISFKLKVDSKVSLKIFNILGQEVFNLVNSDMKAGVQSFKFDASNLASGIYFYRITVEGIDGSRFTDVKKMTLMK